MSRRTVVTRKRQVLKITSLAEKNAAEGGVRLGVLTSELVTPEETMPDWSLVIMLIARLITHRMQAVLALDVDHFNKLLDDAGLREERDRLNQELRSLLVIIRRAAEAVFGKTKSAQLIATDGETPRMGDTLIDQADHAVKNLSDPGLEIPESVVAGLSPPSVQEWIEAIVPVADKLRNVRTSIEAIRREAERKVGLKSKAFDDLDFVLSHGRQTLRGLFFLARMDDIASRFSVRRRSQQGPTPRDERPNSASPPAGEAPSGEPPSEEAGADDASGDPEDSEPSTPPDEGTDAASVSESG